MERREAVACFVAYCESCAQNRKTIILKIRVLIFFFLEKKLYCLILYFFLKIVKFLQLHERRQIIEPRKYYLV